jgi:hypothetical protein
MDYSLLIAVEKKIKNEPEPEDDQGLNNRLLTESERTYFSMIHS